MLNLTIMLESYMKGLIYFNKKFKSAKELLIVILEDLQTKQDQVILILIKKTLVVVSHKLMINIRISLLVLSQEINNK